MKLIRTIKMSLDISTNQFNYWIIFTIILWFLPVVIFIILAICITLLVFAKY